MMVAGILKLSRPGYLQLCINILAMVHTLGNQLEAGVHEYCQWEHFNVTCPEGSLIVMESAHYGRMRIGRCIDSEYQVGCAADVLTMLDGRCSGRPSCLILLPDSVLHKQQPCNKDMMAYLEASYTCIAVSDPEPKSCLETGTISLTQAEGFLASQTAQTLGHGTSSCPWTITVKPGQKIRLIVLDFSIANRYSSETGHPSHGFYPLNVPPLRVQQTEYCHMYATVSEENKVKGVPICAESTREHVVYTTVSNSVSVQLAEAVVLDTSISFIIKFQAIGCADFTPPKEAWTERSNDRLTVRCNHTLQSWHMICKGTSWIGQTSECDNDSPVGEKVVDDSDFPTYGLVIAVVIGIFVGSLCGFLLLAVVLWCRRHSSNIPRYEHEVEMVAPPGDSEHVCKLHRLPTGEYGYTHVWEVRNTQLPGMAGGGIGGPPSQQRPPTNGALISTADPAYHNNLLLQQQQQQQQQQQSSGGPLLIGDGQAGALLIHGGNGKDHVYECPIFDERFLNRVHHLHGYCPHSAAAAVGRMGFSISDGQSMPPPPQQQQGQQLQQQQQQQGKQQEDDNEESRLPMIKSNLVNTYNKMGCGFQTIDAVSSPTELLIQQQELTLKQLKAENHYL